MADTTYSKRESARIRRIVKNFNAKVRYHERKGVAGLPSLISTRELKNQFAKSELKKQLKIYQAFGKRTALNPTKSGRSEWQEKFDAFEKKSAIEFYKKRLRQVRKSDSEYYVLRKDTEKALEAKIAILEGDTSVVKKTTPEDYQGVLKGYLQDHARNIRGQQYFIETIYRAGKLAGIDNVQLSDLARHVEAMSPEQFYQAYITNGAMSRVFEMHPSDPQLWEKFGDDLAEGVLVGLAEAL